MSPLLEVKGLRKDFGAHAVLRNVGFEVGDRERFAVIGPNGAGKTTLFRILTGEILASGGAIRYLGEDIIDLPAHQRVYRGFGRTFQVSRVLLELTALENLVVAVEARLRAQRQPLGRWYQWRPAKAVIEEACHRLDELGLADKRFVESRHLSHGDKKRLELAAVLALEPRVLMLDEPTAGMSPPERRKAADLISRVCAEQGVTVLLTEHDMDVVFGLADRLMVMNYGEVIMTGSPDEVRSNPLVKEIYLGKEMASA